MFLKKTRINIYELIDEYYNSLKNGRGKISKIDKKTFFYIPISISIFLSLIGGVTKDYIVLIVTAMSIISGLLLNMLLLLTSEAKKEPSKHIDPDTRKQLIKETFSTISYTILISMGLIIFLSIFYFLDFNKFNLSICNCSFNIRNYPIFICIAHFIYSVIVMSIIIHVFINVLLIIRRIHKFFYYEIK